MSKECILLTGGAGYIGSHICFEIKKNLSKYDIVVIDNFSTIPINKYDILKKNIENIYIYNINLSSYNDVDNVFKKHNIKYVIHLAGYKSVNESIIKPLDYYNNNITSTINLLNIMNNYKCYNFIFSSSGSVYGNNDKSPLKETANTEGVQTNPYSRTKIYIENILQDLYKSDNNWNIIILRYFNPVGSHYKGLIGEDLNGYSQNLFVNILNVYKKKIDYLEIFGNNYNTKDGTCIRDFIHVSDLANAHIKSLEYIKNKKVSPKIFNIGTGRGYTVMEVVNIFNKLTNNKIKYKISPNREGDIPINFADNSLAIKDLNWKDEYTLEDMVSSSIKWCDNII